MNIKIENESLALALALALIVISVVISVGMAFSLIGNADAAYAGSCYDYGDGLYNATSITIIPVGETPPIEGLNEWYFADRQYEFVLVNGTLITNDAISDMPVTICTHPELAPGVYNITIIGYTQYEEEEVRHYHGGGASGGDGSDRDGDGIPDNIEWFMCTDWKNPDTDSDGLNDFEEIVLGEDGWITDPCNPDTDSDGLLDGDDPCPLDALNECVEKTPMQTVTPTETPEVPEVPDEPAPEKPDLTFWYWLIAGLFGILLFLIMYLEYRRRKLKEE